MERRTLGNTGLEVPVIGLGMEHVPQTEAAMAVVIEAALAGGVGYLDTLYGDPVGNAQFWSTFGPALAPHRDRFALSAHWGDWRFDLDACEQRFLEVLGLMGGRAEVGMIPMVDYFQPLDGPVTETAQRLRRLKEQGRVGAIGISGHVPGVAQAAVERGLIDVLMFPVNLLGDTEAPHQALRRACVEHGVAIIAMKPFAGGTLLVASGKPTGITPAQCLAYTLAQAPVAVTVPGARTAEQLRQNLGYYAATSEERDYRPALANIHTHLKGTCVYCNHCQPCPAGIDIGLTVMMADWARGGMNDYIRETYDGLPVKASACSECGACTDRCPFGVDVVPRIREAAAAFDGGAAG